MPIRTLLATSELSSRRTVHSMCAADPEITLVADFVDGNQLAETMRALYVSLMIVDVKMTNSVDLVAALGTEALQAAIFLVPAINCATKFFHLRGFVYVKTPISESCLRAALEHAKGCVSPRDVLGLDPCILRRLGPSQFVADHSRIVVRTKGRLVVIRTEEIDWIESERNYVRVHVGEMSYVGRLSIQKLEERLDPTRFFRIHRSVIVNLDKVRELRPWPTGEYVVLMRNGKELTLTRSYRTRLPFLPRARIPRPAAMLQGCVISSAESRSKAIGVPVRAKSEVQLVQERTGPREAPGT